MWQIHRLLSILIVWEKLLEGELRWLLVNLSCPVRFFPSYEQICEQIPERKSTMEELGFVNKVVDINANSQVQVIILI